MKIIFKYVIAIIICSVSHILTDTYVTDESFKWIIAYTTGCLIVGFFYEFKEFN